MRKILFITSVVAIIITSCSLFNSRDINKITDWIDVPEEGTEFIYSISEYGLEQGEWTFEIEEVKQEDRMTIIEFSQMGYGPFYFIYDDIEGIMVFSVDDDIDEDYDEIYLATPIQKGNEWDTSLYMGEKEITGINQTKRVGAGVYEDCIVVEHKNAGALENSEWWYSPSVGMFIYSKDVYDDGYKVEYELEEIK